MSLFCLCVYLAATKVTEQSERERGRDWAVYVKIKKREKKKKDNVFNGETESERERATLLWRVKSRNCSFQESNKSPSFLFRLEALWQEKKKKCVK